MRLSKIKLAGFKSFVEPTQVLFPSNLIAVVGPNGCGKSNIIDAVRWVMGESSAKNLRGESMTDVIFNGSSQRKPLGQASVEMIFDNSDQTLVGEYASYNEIAIKRVVTRDSQSHYFLNGTRCRRKDIADIFLGTGLGPRSYSLIGQGTISRLIEAKPEELRVYLEEAAGISKYKERRRETEIHIGHTRENLVRLDDVRGELANQLEKLQRQAKAAVKYKILREQERLLKAQHHALRWQELHQQLELQQQTINEYQLNIAKEMAALAATNNQLAQLKIQQQTATEIFNENQAHYYGIGATIARLEEAVQNQQQRRIQFENDLAQAQQELTVAQQHLATDHHEIARLEQELALLQPQAATATAEYEALQQQLTDVETLRQQWQQQWDNFNTLAAESAKTAHVAQTKIQHLEQALHTHHLRIEKLQQEQATLDDSVLLAKMADLQQQQNQFQTQQTTLTEQLQQQQTMFTLQRETNLQLGQQVDGCKHELQQLQASLTSLEALQYVALGKNNESINDWLQQQALTQHPRLGQQLVVESGWETAVETVLADYLQAICLANFTELDALLASFTRGNVTLIDLSASAIPAGVGIAQSSVLRDKVQCDIPQLNAMMEQVFVAQDLAEARALLPKLNDQQTVITIDGLWFSKGWIRIAKEHDPKFGILQREQRIKQLQQQLVEQQQALTDSKQHYDEGMQSLQDYEHARDHVTQQLSVLHQDVVDNGARMRVVEAEVKQLQQRNSAVDEELFEQHSLLEETNELLYNTRQEWQQAMQAMDLDADKRQQLVNTRDQLHEQLTAVRETAHQQRDLSHQLTIQCNNTQSQLRAALQNSQRTKEHLEALQARHDTLAEAVLKVRQPDVDTTVQLQEKLAEHAAAEIELKAAQQQVAQLTQQLRDAENTRANLDDKARNLQQQLDQIRLDGQTLTVKCTTLEEAIAETEFALAELIELLPQEASIKQWEDQLQRVAHDIQQLGAVNLAAIEEYHVEAERKQYLDSQYEDLTQALTALEDAISKIDRETRQRFKQTYDTVNEKFQTLFPRLFGGGQAYLELTGDDLLSTGVTVMARPPGKRNSSIYLLSGGEKAMTAVALVFAIFQLTPSPFCMLDEVDAPLDDSNVSRFCAMVREMSTQVQFIFVTHNKVTMEMATHLSGVTMHEPGVSRIVSVDIDAAVSFAQQPLPQEERG